MLDAFFVNYAHYALSMLTVAFSRPPATLTTAGWIARGSNGTNYSVDSIVWTPGALTARFNHTGGWPSEPVLAVSYDPATGATVDTDGQEMIALTDFPVT